MKDEEKSIISDIREFLRQDADIIEKKFLQIYSQNYGTPQEIADFREGVFDSFIGRYFPSPYKITKGNIRDTYGRKSNSIDTIIVTPEHPYTIDKKGKFQLIFAEGVHACIELKPNIGNKNELIRSLKQIETVKKLNRNKTPLLRIGNTSTKCVAESLKVPCFVFSMIAGNKIEKLIGEIVEHYVVSKTPIENQFDHIIINNCGIISNYKIREKSYASDRSECILFEPWGRDTLAGMIFKLNDVIHATLPMHENIMSRYLRGFSFPARKYNSINTYTALE